MNNGMFQEMKHIFKKNWKIDYVKEKTVDGLRLENAEKISGNLTKRPVKIIQTGEETKYILRTWVKCRINIK